jgi:hypothetical protein
MTDGAAAACPVLLESFEDRLRIDLELEEGSYEAIVAF